MDQRKITCVCGQQFSEEEFQRHFGSCQPFKSQFKEFDSKFGELLKSYSEPKERLLIVKFLLKQYINVIDKKLKKYYSSLAQNPPPPAPINNDGNVAPPMGPSGMNNNLKINNNQQSEVFKNNNSFMNQNQRNPYAQNPNQGNPYVQNPSQDNSFIPNQSSNPFAQPNNNNNNNNNNDFDGDFNSQPIQQDDNIGTMCQRCKVNPDVGYLACVHPICTNCFIKYAEQEFYNMKCNICQKEIDDQTKKMILGEEKFSKLESQALMVMFGGNLVKCPYKDCGEQNQFEPGSVDYNIRDDQNKVISRESAEEYAKNRCKCGFCKKDFCKECLAMPYHLGFTCGQWKNHNEAKKCRYCDSEIKGFNRGPDDDVCNQSDCKERYMVSCKKRLPCGHKCFGVNGEFKCPPCIDNECKDYKGQFGQNKDDYCPICYSEGLGSSPIVELSCGHYIHYLCLKKRLETKWIGPKITFNHCVCPSCNKWFDCKSVPEIQKMIDENKKLYDEIVEMSLKRLKFEDLDKDPRLTDPNSPWFNKKVEFALKRLSYYMCYVCKKPYFAGRRECGNDPNMNNDDPNKNYNPKDCVCGKDANLAGVAGKTNCPKHGKDFIEYKCKFCCKIASWFCWGTTHFCEDCHKRQCNNDYVSKYPKDKLPKCNKATCEVGGNHPPNGEEYALGCSICRNGEENAKEF